jgi:guanylate kinase
MSKAITELSHAEDFDQILVNDNLEKAFIESENLVKAFITN